MAGLSTCLVLQSQDPTADYILNCKIGNSSVVCNSNLSAVRIETTKVRIFALLFSPCDLGLRGLSFHLPFYLLIADAS